jgi:hypothetical protein
MAATAVASSPNADDRNQVRSDAALGKQVFEKKVGRRPRRADTDFLASEVSHGIDLG